LHFIIVAYRIRNVRMIKEEEEKEEEEEEFTPNFYIQLRNCLG
jgi:hypothetical protein